MKFNFDGIDETDTLEETLKSRVEAIGGTLEKVEISGNHITPCVQVNLILVCLCLFNVLCFCKYFCHLLQNPTFFIEPDS